MIVKKVSYTNFRSLSDEVFLPRENVNIICGKNAAGKTTFLEGIYLFARGKSMRTVHDTEMISFGKEYTAIKLDFDSADENYELRMAYDTAGQKRFQRNGISVRLLSEYIGYFKAVLFAPEHLSMVNDGPGIRRNYLNTAISQLDSAYITNLQKLNYAVRERNALLKKYDDRSFNELGHIYSEQIAKYSAEIAKKRVWYIKLLSEFASGIMSDMSGGKEKPGFRYLGEQDSDRIFYMLTENVEREKKAGMTLFGAHRDEMEITINGKVARSFASQGQKRSISLAMKLAEGEISKKESGEYPVYLFDDVLSELDRDRRKYLLSDTSGKQIIITTCEMNEELSEKKYPVFNVTGGKIIN